MGFVGKTEFTNTSKLLWLTVHLVMLLLVEFGNSDILEDCCTNTFAIQKNMIYSPQFTKCVIKMKEIRNKCELDEQLSNIAKQCSKKTLTPDDCANSFAALKEAEWLVSYIITSFERILQPNLKLFKEIAAYETWLWWETLINKIFEPEFETYKHIPEIVKNKHYKTKLGIYRKWWGNVNGIPVNSPKEIDHTNLEFSCTYDEIKQVMDFDKTEKLNEQECIEIFEKICIKKSKLPTELLNRLFSPHNDGDRPVTFKTIQTVLSNSKEMNNLIVNLNNLPGKLTKSWHFKYVLQMISGFNEIEAPFMISGMASTISLNLLPDEFMSLWKRAYETGLPRAVTKIILEKVSLYKLIKVSNEVGEVFTKVNKFLENIAVFYKNYPRKKDGMLNILFMLKQASERNWEFEKLIDLIGIILFKCTDDEVIPFLQVVDLNSNIQLLNSTINFFKSFEVNNIWRILVENDYTKDVSSFVELDNQYPGHTYLVLSNIFKSKNPGCTKEQLRTVIKDLSNISLTEAKNSVTEKIKNTCSDYVE
ncbi:uncharacterized protein LOC142318830 isoform X1 [Lycorma delicatula]|uniref:uncharacterized protein LOC142318830 isoform X1 n=1 Tax=Lycorma delicatula TaxID=130591 RepID=UPI003F516C22